MKILITDADPTVRAIFTETLPGHELVFIDRPLSHDDLAAHADAEMLSVFVSSAVKRLEIDALPNLKYIVARSTGVDHIDVAYAKGKGIAVANVPKYGAHTVAEFAFALLLAVSRRVVDAVEQVREQNDFTVQKLGGFDLFGKTIGVLGTGAIGRNVVGIARGFGMNVLMFDKFPNESLVGEGAKYVSMDELLAQSDVITVHVPMMPENYHLLGAEQFAKMKKGVVVINTARGDLLDGKALCDALDNGTVAGAGLDVLEGERALRDELDIVHGDQNADALKNVIADHVLLKHPKVIFTPHIAFNSNEAYHEILSVSAQDAASFIAGTPQNVVTA
ncbi:hydroxyacid dehydrogenase [Candidatus Kaiserbacteria bacterium]|nr:hydroxyacid dehydrogenase [Candidatus Kaiserbacteria bacterium]